MYILELIEDGGYDGIYTKCLCVSENKVKLEELKPKVLEELVLLKLNINDARDFIDKEWYPKRKNIHRRSTEEMEALKQAELKVYSEFKLLQKLNISVNNWNLDLQHVSFNIKQIPNIDL